MNLAAGVTRLAFAAYNVVGDGLGVYDVVSAANNGTFGALDTIGLAGSASGLLGIASGLGRSLRTARIVGSVDNAGQAARLASNLNSNPTAIRSSPVTSTAVEGVIPRCFTADTEVLVKMPEAVIDEANQLAVVMPAADEKADESSGLWFLSGAAFVALGVGVVGSSLREKTQERKKEKELIDLDLLFCDYERMEAAVV